MTTGEKYLLYEIMDLVKDEHKVQARRYIEKLVKKVLMRKTIEVRKLLEEIS